MTFLAFADTLIGVGAIAVAASALWLLSMLFVGRAPRVISAHVLPVAALLSVLATLGTLYYSEIVGVTPCTLCWYQRLILYPLAAIFVYGYARKDTRIFPWTIALSSFGLALALYHVSLPLWVSPLFCDAETALCLVQKIKIFGFLTIPMMSAISFFALLVLSIVGFKNRVPNESLELK